MSTLLEQAMFLTGVMQRADAQNGNGRRYPYSILEREMNNYQKAVDSPSLWSTGKLPNPDKQKTIKSSTRQIQVPVRIWTKLQESKLQPV